MINLELYTYRGYTLVKFQTNKVLIHETAKDNWPGPVIGNANDLNEAEQSIDVMMDDLLD
jgi:hypothetical protein